MTEHRKILVIGAGFSGVALTIQLLKRTSAQVVLVERSGVFGRGTAYAAHGEANVLNVRANRMSALADGPSHFTDWLCTNQPDDANPNGFPRRPTYGAYLADTLRTEAAAAPGRFVRRAGQAIALETQERGVSVRLESGVELNADAAVLALGNFAPATPAGAEGAIGAAHYIENSWAAGALERVGRNDDVILLGSGLTAVDALLELAARGWRGRATVVSRRGLLPQAHEDASGSRRRRTAGDGAVVLSAQRHPFALRHHGLGPGDGRAAAARPVALDTDNRRRAPAFPAPPTALVGRASPSHSA